MFWCLSEVSGQTLELESTPAWSSGLANETYSVAWGDVDGDGDLDLVCGNDYGLNTLYENVGGFFSTSPIWSSLDANNTRSVAWGDVDGDGDLDLVCGNYGENSTLYENIDGALSPFPSWSVKVGRPTNSVALGDVDGDGDLDLVCGNYLNNALYENIDGSFLPTPGWSSLPESDTYSVALGDIDGDGDLDLVCGNHDGSNTLYENVDGALSRTPGWLSVPTNRTQSVALGDVDGDGDLDLVCGNNDGSNTLYENVGGTLSTTPNWFSAATRYTYSVAWGDADGDGDLDLVCGNENGGSSLYENVGGSLSTSPSWSSESYGTYCVAWGDVDGDGDLDLACGVWRGSNTLFKNVGDFLYASPSWSSEAANTTWSVVWGDVDGDGDLDLACGNPGTSNTLYENEGGSLSTTANWSSVPANFSTSVAWGDVDGDGDPDLACGNYGSNTLYENVDGALSTTPSWLSTATSGTHSVAWGDVDGDGDFDLICGNAGISNTLYENVGGTLSTTPVWSSGPTNVTLSVALGDVDGDGDLDLVCGNESSSTTLYENVDGVLSTSPAWSSGLAAGAESVAWGDVDGDGDLDLACGNYFRSNMLYENVGGVLSTTASWSSGPKDGTKSVAWGDVDGDGDLDLICGNWGAGGTRLYENVDGSLSTSPSWFGQWSDGTEGVAWADVDDDGDLDLVCGTPGSSMLYAGIRAPVFKGSMTSPANHLPNNGAYLRFVDTSILSPETDNLRLVEFQAFDVEADAFYLSPQFHFEGEASWRPVELEDGSSRAGPFASSREGVTGSFVWDTNRFPADSRKVGLRLLVSEVPSQVSTIQHVASYLKQIGPVEPRRPAAYLEISALQFGTITVGDTASVNITLENRGNETLAVADIDLPSPEMTLTPAQAFEISPDALTELVVSLLPRSEIAASGEVRIHSNDPVNPVLGLAIEAEILPLSFSTELLRVHEVIPLGEAATVIVQAAANVHLERGTLFYRAAGASTFLVMPLAQSGSGFTGIIAGVDITELGLEYYIEMENSGIFATDPPGAPVDSVYFQAVEVPTTISTVPVPNAGVDYQQSLAITINATLPPGSGFTAGSLYFRRGGELEYQAASLAGVPPALSASIPSDQVGPRGLEYYVEIQTATSTLVDPPNNPETSPHTISINVLTFQETDSSPGLVYRMVSMPLGMGEGVYRDWQDLLSVRPEFGPYDPVRWRSYRYDPTTLGNEELDPDADTGLFQLVPGKAFWLICRESHRIGIGAVSGYSMPTESPCQITLAPGWNQVGNPFTFPVAWDSVLVHGVSPDEADTLFDGPIPWVSGTGYGESASVLEPFDGYFVNNLGDTDITLQIPPCQAPSVTHDVLAKRPPGWTITIEARTEVAEDSQNTVGVRASAEPWFDRFDMVEPPMSPGQAISLYFPHGEWRRHGGIYTADFRPELETKHAGEDWGYAFCFDVAKNYTDDEGNEITLSFRDLADVPADAAVNLIDHHLGQTVDLGETTTYKYHIGRRDRVNDESHARFALLIGSEDFVAEGQPLPPRQTALHQNYPNPFNPSTVIRFDLAQAGKVSVRIYNMAGALVKTVCSEHMEPGGYEFVWTAADDNGRRVASGVYFYRLQTSDYVETKRMMLVK